MPKAPKKTCGKKTVHVTMAQPYATPAEMLALFFFVTLPTQT